MAKTFQDLLNKGQAKVLGIVSIVPMDDWNTDTQYQKLNLVRHNGAAYLAKGGSKNVEPGVTQDWQSSWMLVYLDGILSPDGTYPNLTAGRVMHALAWGNKNYDGSSAQTITAADLGLADVYKPQGSVTFANLPATPNESNYGYVWNISDDFTTDSRFLEGAGKACAAGTNVGVIEQDGVYYYDILGNFVDLSNYAKIDGNYQEMTVGQATNAQNAANVTSQINGHAISDIFESDGVTVKEATQAQRASADEDGNNIPDTYAKQNGTYRNLIAGGVDNVDIGSTTNINDYYGADYWGKEYYFAGGNNPQGSPEGISGGHLSVIRAGSSTTIQVIRTGVGSDSSGVPTTYQRDWNGSVWTDWEEIVTADGSYPTLGAGYLPYWSARAKGSTQVGWHLIGSIENRAPYGSRVYSCIILVNGSFPQQGEDNAEESGKLEIDVRLESTAYSGLHLSVLSGNINPDEYCAVIEGTTLKIYAKLPLSYATRTFVIQSEMIETYLAVGTLQTQDTFYGTTAPEGAVYAVNRNVAAKVENALTIIKDGVSTVYDGSEAKNVEIPEGGITVIEIPANDSDTLTSEQLQQVKNNPQNTVLRRTVSPEMNEIYCFDSVSMTQGADSAYTFRNVTSMAQNSLTLQAISVNLSSGLWVYSSVQTSAGGGGSGGVNFKTVSVVARGQGRVSYYSYSNGSLIINTVQLTNGLDKDFVAVSGMPILISGNPGINIDNIYNADVIVLSAMVGSATNAILANATGSNPSFRIVAGTGGDN